MAITTSLATLDDDAEYQALPPGAQGLVRFMGGLLGQQLGQITDGIMIRVNAACDALKKTMTAAQNPGAGHDHDHGAGVGCKCGGECQSCKSGSGVCELGAPCDSHQWPVPVETAAGIRGVLKCYKPCRVLDPCIVWMYLEDRRDLDSAAWENLLTTDGSLVHMKKSVGAAPYEVNYPLAANKKILFTQEAKQQLSFWPEIIKIEADWNGTPVPSQVTLRFYTGDKGLTGLVDTSALTPIGDEFTLSDFACGTSCYVIPFPSVKLCPMGHIPMRRALYVEVVTGAIGAATLQGVSIVIIKRGTEMYELWRPMLLKRKLCVG